MIVARPHRAYLVCATPRSGSTLLCQALQGTGVAGRPEEFFERLRATGLPRQPREYFGAEADRAVLELLPETDAGAPLSGQAARARLERALRAGLGADGVFGAKMMWSYFDDFVAGMRDAGLGGDGTVPELLAELFGDLRYVQVLRGDKVAQAVSLWTALQTQAWRDEGDAVGCGDAIYHRGAIRHLVEQLAAQEAAWTAWFAEYGIEPAVVVYEQLAGAVEPTVRALLEELGLRVGDEWHFRAPRLRRQADERSERWAARFVAEDGGAVAL